VLGPQRAPVRAWLHAHDAAAWFADRHTDAAFASCDGTAGVSAGTWQGGWYAMVWKRQKKLDYKWLLADAAPLAAMPPGSDFITGKLADCPPRPAPEDGPRPAAPALRALPGALPPPPADADSRDGRSDDGSLVWRSSVMPDGAHALRVWIWQDGAMHAVIDRVTPRGGG
jgi:hypothetical protein